MKKLKVLILSDYAFAKGGAEQVALASAVGLARNNHEVVFFSAVGTVSEELKSCNLKEIICLNQRDILDNPSKLKAMISGIYNFEDEEIGEMADKINNQKNSANKADKPMA